MKKVLCLLAMVLSLSQFAKADDSSTNDWSGCWKTMGMFPHVEQIHEIRIKIGGISDDINTLRKTEKDYRKSAMAAGISSTCDLTLATLLHFADLLRLSSDIKEYERDLFYGFVTNRCGSFNKTLKCEREYLLKMINADAGIAVNALGMKLADLYAEAIQVTDTIRKYSCPLPDGLTKEMRDSYDKMMRSGVYQKWLDEAIRKENEKLNK